MSFVRAIRISVPILNVVLLCVNGAMLVVNQHNLIKIYHQVDSLKDMESAYKVVLCTLVHHITGEEDGRISTTTLDGKVVQFTCPAKV